MSANPKPSVDLQDPPVSVTHKSRHVAKLSNVPLLGRSGFMSRIQQAASQAPPGSNFPGLITFVQFWKWIGPYLHDFVHTNAPYQSYPAGKTGIFDIAMPPEQGPLRIAVAADWGTGTQEADNVATNMMSSFPHYTLHLGDVYYMGEVLEIDENCLGEKRGRFTGVKWPTGSLGSFALMGNHEMYSGGQAYFQRFITKLGLLNPNKSVRDPQSASYFCLVTHHWVILGLDTGYHSGGVPLFGKIPIINRIPSANVDAHFDDIMLAWLKQTMNTADAGGGAKKPVLVLTHHQPISSFEKAFDKPVKQLAQLGSFDDREFVWLYGHEHRLTVYNEQALAPKLKAYPRCIGHGGMPVEVTKLSKADEKILYYDPREHPIDRKDPDTKVGCNGHVVLLFEGSELKVEYRDMENNRLLLSESFQPGAGGSLVHSSVKPDDSELRSGQQTSV